MTDLHRPRQGRPDGGIGLSGRELAIIGTSLGVRKADLLGMRRFAEAAELPVEAGRYAGLILEVELLLVKLGLAGDGEEATRR